MATITTAVGSGVTQSSPVDIRIVQQLLNKHRQPPLRFIDETGVINADTIDAIKWFQSTVMRQSHPDGRVDPNGRTIKRLAGPPLPPGGVPGATGSFGERLEAFIGAATAAFGITVNKNCNFRAPDDAQKMHVAHMIRYNSYGKLAPASYDLLEGHKVIAWSVLSDAKTVWTHVDASYYLRDKNGAAPVRQGEAWAEGKEPDETKTRARALEILKNFGVATSAERSTDPNSAMVAPGYDGCAGPCKCGGGRSRHVGGMAADLDQGDLAKLKTALQGAGQTLDEYLTDYGLKRPMSSEPWHVEAI